jgi:cephalosporin hydroxylase
MDNQYELNLSKIVDGHFNVTYRTIRMVKCPFDYVIYQMILNEVKPDLVIEIGTNHGGTALYLADLMDLLGKGEIHTIDIVEYPIDNLILNHKRIKRFLGGYEKYDLKNCEGFETILVIDDGSHVYNDTLTVLEKFKDVVSVNSYFIIEDGALIHIGLENQFNGGPVKAIKEFLQDNFNFIIDRKWCNFFGKNTTFNINGYIKKIR